MSEESTITGNPNARRWQIVGWIGLGCLLAVILMAIFLAYGQPELLLRDAGLRYCG